jgi:stringent starvation protein B
MDHDSQPMTSTKPYLIRAIYEWILDNGMTPHLVVDVGYPGVAVPQEFVEDGRLVLNLSPSAVRGLVIGNDRIDFNARFGGVARDVFFPVESVLGIFTRENGQGMVFPEVAYPSADEQDTGPTAEPVRDEGRPRGPVVGLQGSKSPSGKGKGKGGGPTLKVVK